MFWLVIIWIVAALCGLAAAAIWEPLLAMSLAIARTIDPGLANYLAQSAGIVEAGGDAIGWLVALAVGLPLTLLWLVLRVVGSLLRGPDGRPNGEHRLDDGRHVRDRPASRLPDAERIDRPAPRGATFDVSPRQRRDEPTAAPREMPREPTPACPDPEPPVDRSPPVGAPPPDTPRWGRQ